MLLTKTVFAETLWEDTLAIPWYCTSRAYLRTRMTDRQCASCASLSVGHSKTAIIMKRKIQNAEPTPTQTQTWRNRQHARWLALALTPLESLRQKSTARMLPWYVCASLFCELFPASLNAWRLHFSYCAKSGFGTMWRNTDYRYTREQMDKIAESQEDGLNFVPKRYLRTE